MAQNDDFDFGVSPAPSRSTKPHVTQPPVNSLDEDDLEREYVHESNYVSGRNAFSNAANNRARRDINPNSPYGQYLSVPKGHKQIFARRERNRRIKSVFALIAVIAAVVIAILVVWFAMSKLPFIGL